MDLRLDDLQFTIDITTVLNCIAFRFELYCNL